MARLLYLKDSTVEERDFWGPSGYFCNMSQEYLLSEIELGHRATSAIEDESLGFGPMLDAIYDEYLRNGDDDLIQATPIDDLF